MKQNADSLYFEDDSVIQESFNKENGQIFPLLIRPGSGNANLNSWIKKNESHFQASLVKYGAILFRGFGVDSVAVFNEFMKCFNTEPLPYMFRSSPRKELDEKVKNVYTSTIYPNDRSINMHNESSYSRVWGQKIVFCCIEPASEGGETPIADSRKVLKDIDRSLVEKFKTRGVKYQRNLFEDLGMPWQEVFQTTDFEVVKDTCKKNAISYRVINKDKLVIEWTKPAVYTHPVSQEETWFNHVYFFNKYSRYEELGLAPYDFFPDDFLTSNTFFGDGTEISYDEYREIGLAYRKNSIAFPYEKGDILFLENMLTAHGRNPYKGNRVIATTIIEPVFDTIDSPPAI
jgi:hypothetical protein